MNGFRILQVVCAHRSIGDCHLHRSCGLSWVSSGRWYGLQRGPVGEGAGVGPGHPSCRG